MILLLPILLSYTFVFISKTTWLSTDVDEFAYQPGSEVDVVTNEDANSQQKT